MATEDIPFTFLDYFLYLIPGTVIWLALWTLIVGINPITMIQFFENYKGILAVFIVGAFIIFYALGHLIAAFAYFIIVEGIINIFLNHPTYNFFKGIKKENLHWYSLKKYSAEKSQFFKDKFKTSYKTVFGVNIDLDNEENYGELFDRCFFYVKEKSDKANARLNTFLSLYDFSRNFSIALLFYTIILGVKMALSHTRFTFNLFLLFILLIVSIYIFFLRFLKFYRLFAEEVYQTFMILGNPATTQSGTKLMVEGELEVGMREIT